MDESITYQASKIPFNKSTTTFENTPTTNGTRRTLNIYMLQCWSSTTQAKEHTKSWLDGRPFSRITSHSQLFQDLIRIELISFQVASWATTRIQARAICIEQISLKSAFYTQTKWSNNCKLQQQSIKKKPENSSQG